MELRDCFIGKIVKTHGDEIPVHITGLGLNSSGDVILEIEYPKLDSLYEGTVDNMKRDSNTSKIVSVCEFYRGKRSFIHPANVEEL